MDLAGKLQLKPGHSVSIVNDPTELPSSWAASTPPPTAPARPTP